MSVSTTADCSGLVNNPDISGVGVRISFYLQTFFLVLLVDRSWQDAPGALWTFIATSFGLIVAAVVQAQDEQLSLFQALVVSNLVWLANFGTFVALASYSRKKAFGAMLQTLLSMALTLYIWSTAATFGNQPSCNPIVNYMLFVIKVPALGSGRTVGLIVSSLLTAIYLVITLQEMHSFIHGTRKKRGQDTSRGSSVLPLPATAERARSMSTASSVTASSLSSPILMPSPIVSPRSISYAESSPNTPASPASSAPVLAHRQRSKARPKRRRWFADLDPMLVGIVICQIMVFTYFVVATELLLTANQAVDNSWGFGQILALILVIPAGLAVLDALAENGLGRTSTRKRVVSRPRQKRAPSSSSFLPPIAET